MALRQLRSALCSSGLCGAASNAATTFVSQSAAGASSGVAAARAGAVRAWASAPSVFDSIVHFTIIDTDGKRYTVKGLEGESVASALEESATFGGRDIFTYGPDLQAKDTHIYVSQDYVPQLGNISDAETTALAHCADEQRNNSRMAAYVKLDKGVTGIVMALAPNAPWATP